MSDVIRPRGSYGVDAPWVPWLRVGFAVFYAALAVVVPTLWHAPWWVGVLIGTAAACFLLGAGFYWHATFRGKFVVWDRLLSSLAESDSVRRVLDLGCGRGAVAIQSALRMPQANVEGIDLWRSIDQSHNSPGAA